MPACCSTDRKHKKFRKGVEKREDIFPPCESSSPLSPESFESIDEENRSSSSQETTGNEDAKNEVEKDRLRPEEDDERESRETNGGRRRAA